MMWKECGTNALTANVPINHVHGTGLERLSNCIGIKSRDQRVSPDAHRVNGFGSDSQRIQDPAWLIDQSKTYVGATMWALYAS